uniref:site-specific DNA-methyltransferase (adenine-specific) n=1 Tax=viral metagenome TaxID=1070528 RepID=A0A6C0JX66_9ZZZZ
MISIDNPQIHFTSTSMHPISHNVLHPLDEFVFQTMLTCIGNKRKLVGHIYDIVETIRQRLGKEKLCIMDGFTGSGVVARALVPLCHTMITNDLENYSYLMSRCFLNTPTNVQQSRIAHHITYMNNMAISGPYFEYGIISKLYAPKNTNDVKIGERCFYTRENALIIDTLRKYIADCVEPDLQTYCLVPLLIKASIHTNTAGVFKGFYKDGELGCFGGSGRNALSRIMKPISLDMPIWSKESYNGLCYNRNINEIIDTVEVSGQFDVLYLDPPYNQHPYGSNYFMLNVIAKNEEPEKISKVSGIPTDWNKSAYNSKATAIRDMEHLLRTGLSKSHYIVLSYNDEGIITTEDWAKIFEPYAVEKREILYDTFKGSRNLKDRSNKVVEIMYIISSKK